MKALNNIIEEFINPINNNQIKNENLNNPINSENLYQESLLNIPQRKYFFLIELIKKKPNFLNELKYQDFDEYIKKDNIENPFFSLCKNKNDIIFNAFSISYIYPQLNIFYENDLKKKQFEE